MEQIADSSILGAHLNPWTAEWMGFDELQIAKDILSMSFSEVRVALRFSDVVKTKADFKNRRRWNYSRTERLVEVASKAGKKIHFQTGFYKSLGYPESHLGWVFNEYPGLLQKGARLDQFPELNQMALEYDFQTSHHFLSQYPNIVSVQVGNEPFSKHLEVSNGRYISRQFNDQEITTVRLADPLKGTLNQRPVVQNIPWDTPQSIVPVLRDSNIDILGLNIYNNVKPSFNLILWPFVAGIKAAAGHFGKEVMVTEYQCSPWLNDKREPVYNFSWERFYAGLERLKGMPVFLYDLEVLFYFAKNGDVKAQDFLRKYS